MQIIRIGQLVLVVGLLLIGLVPTVILRAQSDVTQDTTEESQTALPIAQPFRAYYWQNQGSRLLGLVQSTLLTQNGVTVQYFEKGRLEDHRALTNNPEWAFAYGRLTAELMEQHPTMQIGSSNMTYGDLQTYSVKMYPPPNPNASGPQQIESGIFVPANPLLEPGPGYIVPPYFWDYVNQAALFPGGWLHDVGLPMTNAMQVDWEVDGVSRPVMMQAFERTLLTYDPTKPEAWQVERANIGTDALIATGQTPLFLTPTAPRYVFPVQNAPCDYGRFHHDYPAADIFCPVGSTVVATTDGVVDWITTVDQWEPATNLPEHRGGLSIAIIGDDGLRYYGSHLDAVDVTLQPGTRVTAGQYLGTVGISGNALGTPPHLHYGISYPTTPADWEVRRGIIPPYDYLQAWQRGEMITPGTGLDPLPVPPLVGEADVAPAPAGDLGFPRTAIDALFDNAGGMFGVVVYDTTDDTLHYNRAARQPFVAASLIKLPIALTLYQMAEAGEIDLDTRLTLQADDIVGGSGVIQQAPVGSRYTLRELGYLMLAESDNTATNMLLDYLGGFEPVNRLMIEVGATQTFLDRKMMDFAAIEAGRDNLTSPADMLLLLQLLTDNELLSIASTEELRTALLETSDRQKIPARLPANVVVYHKVGALTGVEHDVGIVETPQGRRYLLVFMSSGLPSNAVGIDAIARAAELVYSYAVQSGIN